MSEEEPRILRDVELVSYGPGVTGMGEILSVTEAPLVHGDCGMDVVDPGWYHGVAGPPMAYPGDGCER